MKQDVVKITKDGRVHELPRTEYDLTYKTLERWGWKLDEGHEREQRRQLITEIMNDEPQEESTHDGGLSREDMIEFLKSKGKRVHWNLSTDKLREQYESENQTS
jgi:hypothetical protein